jgi:hypothetical protein
MFPTRKRVSFSKEHTPMLQGTLIKFFIHSFSFLPLIEAHLFFYCNSRFASRAVKSVSNDGNDMEDYEATVLRQVFQLGAEFFRKTKTWK